MPAPTISHVILTGALIILVFTVQLFYFYVTDNMWAEMARRELKEITDYVADTLANLYFLVNSTRLDTTLRKTLLLPSRVAGSSYTIELLSSGGFAQSVQVYFDGKTWVNAASWLPPGLRVNFQANQQIWSLGRTAVAGCSRASKNVYVWLTYEVG